MRLVKAPDGTVNNFERALWLTMPFDLYLRPWPAACRIFAPDAETRTLALDAETRVFTPDAETRTLLVGC